MKIVLNVKDTEMSKTNKVVALENKTLSKDIKILSKNVARLEEIQGSIVREQDKNNMLINKNVDLKSTLSGLQTKVNDLMKQVII